jgi:delta 1-pyrroline-5-carboxylate dehydrogenase
LLESKPLEFDQEMIEFNSKFEEQIDTHISSNAFYDRKFVGATLGCGAFGGVGFLVFSGTIAIGISAGKFNQ